MRPAFARDNCPEVFENAEAGGWQINEIYSLDHQKYLYLTALSIATWGSGAAAEVAAEVVTAIRDRENLELAETLVETLYATFNGDNSSSINYAGADYKLALLTCQHWHNEQVPYCEVDGWNLTCGMRWVKVQEPNTHYLVLGIRDTEDGSAGVESLFNNNGVHPEFQYVSSAAISGHNDLGQLANVTPAQCALACNETDGCQSFDYHKNDAKCDLSSALASDDEVGGLKTDYRDNPYDHYSRVRQDVTGPIFNMYPMRRSAGITRSSCRM